MIEITLPWPPSTLSPNSRTHWRFKAKAAKKYRQECGWIARAAGLIAPAEGKLHLWLDFYPPDRRHRDDDNLIASFKSGRDGIADALGVNDSRFVCHPMIKEQIGGMVKVRITGGPG